MPNRRGADDLHKQTRSFPGRFVSQAVNQPIPPSPSEFAIKWSSMLLEPGHRRVESAVAECALTVALRDPKHSLLAVLTCARMVTR